MAVGRQDPGVVAHEHHQEDQGRQCQREPHRLDSQSRNETKGQRGEVVVHLVLGQLGGAEPGDGEDTEEAQSEADAAMRTRVSWGTPEQVGGLAPTIPGKAVRELWRDHGWNI